MRLKQPSEDSATANLSEASPELRMTSLQQMMRMISSTNRQPKQVAAIPPLPVTIYRKNEVNVMEFANDVITLIGNIFSCALILTFLIGLIYGIRFMLQIKQQEKEEYERKKKKDELDYKESELRYQKLFEDKR